MGASVGKLLGMAHAMKGGLGMASLRAGELVVAALAVVNALGDVVDPATGAILAGARDPSGQGFLDTARALRAGDLALRNRPAAFTNTVIGVVATNACLAVARANELAAAAHDGLARAVRPAHTLYDGDALFALATGKVEAEFIQIADLAAEATARAIVNAILAAEPAGGLPAA
jgi:L-aminopeptidase/D-esterase-like protein